MYSTSYLILDTIIKALIALMIAYFLILIFLQLRSRKRKNKDPIIFIWNIFIINALITLSLWVFGQQDIFSALQIDMILGKMIFSGTFMTLVLAMLLKIIPFLIWQHLSLEQMKKMNFNVTLPHMKELITDKHQWMVAGLIVFHLLSLLANLYLVSGLVLLTLALLLIFLVLNAFKIYQEKLMEIGQKDS